VDLVTIADETNITPQEEAPSPHPNRRPTEAAAEESLPEEPPPPPPPEQEAS
jgi:hypothetical protein